MSYGYNSVSNLNKMNALNLKRIDHLTFPLVISFQNMSNEFKIFPGSTHECDSLINEIEVFQ